MKPRSLANKGFVSIKELPCGPHGRALCRCCGTEVPEGRRTFCSGQRATFVYKRGTYLTEGFGCVHEHCVRSNPGYARKCVWARDQGKCAICGVVALNRRGEWQADHIVPVAEGGGSCDLSNLRTLCTACHRVETAALAKRRAEARKAAKSSAPQ